MTGLRRSSSQKSGPGRSPRRATTRKTARSTAWGPLTPSHSAKLRLAAGADLLRQGREDLARGPDRCIADLTRGQAHAQQPSGRVHQDVQLGAVAAPAAALGLFLRAARHQRRKRRKTLFQ